MANAIRFLTLVLFFIPTRINAQNFDVTILKSVYKNETAFKDHFYKADAQSVTVFNITAPVGIFAEGLIKHDKKLQEEAFYMAGAFVLSSIVVQGTKIIVKRSRRLSNTHLFFQIDMMAAAILFHQGIHQPLFVLLPL